MSNSVILDLFGLNETINGDGCGMRPRMTKLRNLFNPVADVEVATHDGLGMDYAIERALDNLSGYTNIVVGGHSFGVARAVWLMERYRGKVMFFFAFDGAPNAALGQNYPWSLADHNEDARWAVPACVERWVSFTQRNDVLVAPGLGIGICGVPFKPDARGENINCNEYGPDKINLGLTHAGKTNGVCTYDPLYETIATGILTAANMRLNAAWANK